MGFLTIVFVAILGIIFAYSKKLKHFVLLFLFTLFYLPLLLNWMGVYQYQGFVPIFLIVVLMLFYYPKLIRSKTFKLLMVKMILVIFLLCSVILISSFINDYSFFKGVLFFRNYFWGYILFSILTSIRLPVINIKKIFLFIFISQLILVVIQYFGSTSMNQMFLLLEYEKDGDLQQATASSVIEQSIESGGHLLVGTLGKITKLANFLSFFITFWIGVIMSKQKKLQLLEATVAFLPIGIILLIGTRSPLASAVIGAAMAFVLVHQTRKKTIYFISLCTVVAIIAVPTLMAMGSSAMTDRADYGNAFERSISLFGYLANIGQFDTTNAATLGRSIYLLQFVTYETILFGTGIYTNNPFGYGPGISSITDCMIVFIIAEFGVLVFALCFIPYLMAIFQVKKKCSKDTYKAIAVLFIVIFLQTIVDQGMFDMLNSYCFYIICALFINEQRYEKCFFLDGSKKVLSSSPKLAM